jgi:transaldolase/transaldolase/glucose-6-phosphate isomerase
MTAEEDRDVDRAQDDSMDATADKAEAKASRAEPTALQRLCEEHGQSPWLDFIDRDFMNQGELTKLIQGGIRGLTSNPTIFAKAVAEGSDYDELISRHAERGASNEEIFEEIAVWDVGDAADMLRGVHDDSAGRDGFASIEVEPALAGDTQATLERARHLWGRLERPNVMIKIPATEAGLPAISAAIAEGININVTLTFSIEMYRRVAAAYLDGLTRLRASGGDVSRVASVASFFVSRVDTKVDKMLDEIGTSSATALRGKAAIANAKLAYRAYGEIFDGAQFRELRAAGAAVQRCLWASTSTKNPNYRDVLYVEELIGPDTIDTMPIQTIADFLDHGRVERTLDRDVDAAAQAIREIEAQGIDMETVTAELLDEGVAAFANSVDELLASIESKRKTLAAV